MRLRVTGPARLPDIRRTLTDRPRGPRPACRPSTWSRGGLRFARGACAVGLGPGGPAGRRAPRCDPRDARDARRGRVRCRRATHMSLNVHPVTQKGTRAAPHQPSKPPATCDEHRPAATQRGRAEFRSCVDEALVVLRCAGVGGEGGAHIAPD
eukprot:5283410-Prymnesium_polylepis.2